MRVDIESSELEVEHCLEMLLPRLQKKVEDRHSLICEKSSSSTIVGKSFLSESKPPILIKKKGRVYWKLVLESRNDFGGHSSTVYGFIRKSDGAIFRPATWRKPETRTRKAIKGFVTEEFPEDYFTAFGVVYDMEC
ncbi:MAG: hypothetical protein H8E74_01180 [Gammaproteobacteria bacterium]|nr:hypothetical protein [Gammaproteobacteria bacterium]